jgi:D-alanyl-D-alanine carboxypeptidase
MTPFGGTTPRARTLAAPLLFILALLLLAGAAACDRDVSTPVVAGFDERELQAILDDAVTRLRIPGAVVSVTSANGAEWTGASGVSDLFNQTPMRTTDLLRVGSLTKAFVGVITLQLVDEGRLSLDDTLQDWLPELNVPAADSITVRMLLNHTSGIPNYLKADTFQQALIHSLSQPWAPDTLVAIAGTMPRSTMGIWAYANTNYILLGLIIQKATGSTFQAQLQSRILNRLGMTSTTFDNDSLPPPGMVSGYCDWGSTSNYQVQGLNASIAWTAGALVSSVHDIARFGKALASGELISGATYQQQITTLVPTYSFAPNAYYGLGIVSSEGWLGHKGDIFGFNAVMYSRPGVGTIVVITNRSPNSQEAAPDIFRAFSGRLFNSYPFINLSPMPGTAAGASRAPVPDGFAPAVATDTMNVCTTTPAF